MPRIMCSSSTGSRRGSPVSGARCWTMCRSRSTPASWWCSKAPPGAASRPRCTSSPRSTGRQAGASSCSAATSRAITGGSTGTGAEDVGVIFQLHNLLPHLSVLQNVEIVMLGTKRHRHARIARAHELLDAVGLTEQANSYPPELSGGERQRVAVARAFANDPPLVLADEPTNSLDDDTAAAVIALLRDRCRRGGAVLAVSHDHRLTSAADRVLRLAGGKVTELQRAGADAPAGGD